MMHPLKTMIWGEEEDLKMTNGDEAELLVWFNETKWKSSCLQRMKLCSIMAFILMPLNSLIQSQAQKWLIYQLLCEEDEECLSLSVESRNQRIGRTNINARKKSILRVYLPQFLHWETCWTTTLKQTSCRSSKKNIMHLCNLKEWALFELKTKHLFFFCFNWQTNILNPCPSYQINRCFIVFKSTEVHQHWMSKLNWMQKKAHYVVDQTFFRSKRKKLPFV